MEYSEFVNRLAKPLPTKEQRIEHALIGLLGELGEITDTYKKHLIYEQPLDRANLLEELGDFAFYFQMLLTEHDQSEISYRLYSLEEVEITGSLMALSLWIGSYYGNAGNNSIYQMWVHWNNLRMRFDFDFDEVLQHNMDKLNTRYQKGYTNTNAQLRLDKA